MAYNANLLNFNASKGSMTMGANAAVVGGTGTFIKGGGTTILGTAVNFDMPLNNRLRCLNKPGLKKYLVSVECNLQTTSNNRALAIQLYKNGIAIGTTIKQAFAESGNQAISLGISEYVDLQLNDYVELWVTNITNNNNVTITKLNFTIQE